MTRIPAPLLRGLTVLAIGATLAVSHAAFAAPGPSTKTFTEPTSLVRVSEGGSGREASAAAPLQDNCYLETEVELTPRGKVVSKLVSECD